MDKEYEPEWGNMTTGSSEVATPKQHGAAAVKQIVTIRLDVDMLEWFKSAGPGYQTRINQVLREHMELQRASVQPGEN
jgi:uncharacterized protein (DUF4415 family)